MSSLIERQSGDAGAQLTLVVRAASFAADKHKHQRRKGRDGVPYIVHPLAVAQILTEAGVTDAEVLAAALLHDTVEDTGTLLEELEHEFGTRVASIVSEVTDDKRQTKVDRKRQQIIHAHTISLGAKLVKMADKIANVRDLLKPNGSPWGLEITQGYVVWAREVCRGLRGANEKLDSWADALWTASLTTADGSVHPAIPAGNPVELLEHYYSIIH